MHSTRAQNPVTRPTRNDVARLANISGATVSRVLSGRTDVSISPEARAKVLAAARELGYSPNPAAKALRAGKSGLIGFWMCLQYSRYRSQVVDEMRKVIHSTGFSMAVTDADEEYTLDQSFARVLRMPVDGIIAFDASASVHAFAEHQEELAPNVPFVSMGAYWSEARNYVGVDLRAGAEAAMDHLIGAGRKGIAYLAPYRSGLRFKGPRYEGYRAKMLEAGMEPTNISVEATTIEAVEEGIRERLESGLPLDAILCMNDDLAMDAAPALERLGLRVGKDVALVGFNGTEGIERSATPLTTVRQPIEKMCATAFQFLQAQMDDPSAPYQCCILKPELVIRESSLW